MVIGQTIWSSNFAKDMPTSLAILTLLISLHVKKNFEDGLL